MLGPIHCLNVGGRHEGSCHREEQQRIRKEVRRSRLTATCDFVSESVAATKFLNFARRPPWGIELSKIDFDKLTTADKVAYTDRAWWDEMGKNPDNVVIQEKGWFQFATPSSRSMLANGVCRCELDESKIDTQIEKTIKYFRSHNVPFHWEVAPSSRPTDLPHRLKAAGFKKELGHDGYVGDPAKVQLPPPSSGIEVVPLTPAHFKEWGEVMGHHYLVEPHALERMRKHVEHQHANHKEWIKHFVARHNNDAVGIVQARYHHGYVLFQGASVRKEHRSKGVFPAMFGALIGDAKKSGVGLIVLHVDHAAPSPMYAKLGFEKTCEYQTFVWRPH
jgi:GNAT superfamily N-acetyltransferase